MRLWTFQPPEVMDMLNQGIAYTCDPEKSPWLDDNGFIEAYNWVNSHLTVKNPKPDHIKYPVWAWHTSYDKHRKPDLRRAMFSGDGNNYLIEIEIPDHIVLLTDYQDYHDIVNEFPSKTDSEYEQDIREICNCTKESILAYCPHVDHILEEYSNMSEKEKLATWDKNILDIEDKPFIQACFWELKPDQIIKVIKT